VIEKATVDNVRGWADGPTALGARGGALEEVGVGTSTEVATTLTMAAAAAQVVPRCLQCVPCAVVSVGED